jgi:hypothetical protein
LDIPPPRVIDEEYAALKARLAEAAEKAAASGQTIDTTPIDERLRRWEASCQRDFEEWQRQWRASHPDSESDESADARPARKRKPSIRELIRQAENVGKPVTSVTTPEGYTLNFGEPHPIEASNPWLADLDEKVTKQ